jgi:hypothetical protein
MVVNVVGRRDVFVWTELRMSCGEFARGRNIGEAQRPDAARLSMCNDAVNVLQQRID